MFGNHFYNQTIRRAVSAFGAIFNDINIIRRDGSGSILNIVKVPLSYGPKQKFLSRIYEQASLNDPKVAIKLPRMSFEITSMAYDTNTKMQKGHRSKYIDPDDTSRANVIVGPVGYRMGFQLNIMAKNQDDALQILEQILPFFQPDYTITVNQVDDNYKSDMPIVLQGVTMADDYEGDYLTRRALIYTLDFETRVRFYGGVVNKAVIKRTIANIFNDEGEVPKFLERQDTFISPSTVESEAEPHTKELKYVGLVPDTIVLGLDTVAGFDYSKNIIGLTSGSVAYISSVQGNEITVFNADGLFEVGETISVVGDNGTTAIIQTQTEDWS